MNLEIWQWAFLATGALIIGLSKTGIGGLGMLAVVLFANALPARQATGLVLPMLILGDVLAVFFYRQHAHRGHLLRLFPWTAAGVVAGWLVVGRLGDREMARLIGLIVAAMLGVHLWRQRSVARGEDGLAAGSWLAPVAGLLAGFTTLVANAAGPVMTIYLLAMQLPKLEFLGTGAVFFMLINWFKVPFMVQLDLINPASLRLNLMLAPAVLVGALAGRFIAGRIEQKTFETIATVLAALAAAKLLLF